jgi:hypothetical protein
MSRPASDCRMRCTTALLSPSSRAIRVTPSVDGPSTNSSSTSATREVDSVPPPGSAMSPSSVPLDGT